MQELHTQQQPNTGMKAVVLIVLIIIITMIGYLLYLWLGKPSSDIVGADDGVYEAVFLTNGQVYFSKVDDREKPFVTLSDIYYLRVQQNLQPATNQQQQQPSISLVKLGNELHGPEDVMYVNKDHILFIEPLKVDSNVVQAIRKDKAGLQ